MFSEVCAHLIRLIFAPHRILPVSDTDQPRVVGINVIADYAAEPLVRDLHGVRVELGHHGGMILATRLAHEPLTQHWDGPIGKFRRQGAS